MASNLTKTIKQKDSITLFVNFTALFLIRAVDIIVPLLVLPYLIKTVGVNNYGIYAFIFSVVYFFLYIYHYGFSLSAVKEIAQYRDDIHKVNIIFNRVFYTRVFIFLVGTIVFLIFIFLVKEVRDHLFLALTTYILIIGDILNPTWLYQGMEKMKYMTIVNITSKLTYIILVFSFINTKADYIYIGLLQSVGFILAGSISFPMALKVFRLKLIKIPFSEVLIQLKTGFSSFVTLFIPMLYANTSIFLLGIFGLPAQVTYFDTAYKMSNGFVSVNQILTNVFYPFVNRNSNKFTLVAIIMLSIGGLMSLSCFILSDWLINFLFGSELKNSIIILKILSFSPLLLSIRSVFGINYLLVKNKDNLYMRIAFFSSIIAFLIGLFLIYYYKSIGAALVVIIAQIMYSFSSLFFALKIMKNKDS